MARLYTSILGLMLGVLGLTGCTGLSEPERIVLEAGDDPMLRLVGNATDRLVAQIPDAIRKQPIIVASAQNNDALPMVCPQGRIISEVVSSRLTQKGFLINEIRLSNRLQVSQEGETLLSRDIQNLATDKQAHAAITATWTAFDQRAMYRSPAGVMYITLKAIRIPDGLILGSQSFAVPMMGRGCYQ